MAEIGGDRSELSTPPDIGEEITEEVGDSLSSAHFDGAVEAGFA